MNELFTVIFQDDSNFLGGSSHDDSRWLEVPSKKIKSIFFKLPLGDWLYLYGYDKYCMMFEVTKDLNGDKSGILNTEFIRLFCKTENKVKIYKINCRNNNNNIEITTVEDSAEEITRINKIGWRG